MKKNTLRTLIGITQEDLAQLLNVSRSQLSLYELGKRKLPIAASIKLVDMLAHLQNKENELGIKNIDDGVNEQRMLNELLLKNEYQQLLTAKKIRVVEKKQKRQYATLKTIQFLKKDEEVSQKENKLTLRTISKSEYKLNPVISSDLIRLKIKQEMLLFENKILKKYLKITIAK